MWRLAREEAEDAWVPYDWKEGEVRPPSNTCARLPLTRQDESVVDALGKLIVSEDKRDRLTCTTKGLEYLDKAH